MKAGAFPFLDLGGRYLSPLSIGGLGYRLKVRVGLVPSYRTIKKEVRLNLFGGVYRSRTDDLLTASQTL